MGRGSEPARAGWSVLAFTLVGAALVACESPRARAPAGRGSDSCEARLDATFQAFASTRRSCSTSAECSIVRADCPLKSVAVRWTQADQVVLERERLLAEAAHGGSCAACADGAAPPPVASCVDGGCTLSLPTLGDGP
jgi:hypothetical protein